TDPELVHHPTKVGWWQLRRTYSSLQHHLYSVGHVQAVHRATADRCPESRVTSHAYPHGLERHANTVSACHSARGQLSWFPKLPGALDALTDRLPAQGTHARDWGNCATSRG